MRRSTGRSLAARFAVFALASLLLPVGGLAEGQHFRTPWVGSGIAAGAIRGTTTSLAWSGIFTRNAPAARNFFGMAYDGTDRETVLYGGYNPTLLVPFFNDTWIFRAGTWKSIAPASHPSADSGLVLAYFPPLHGVVAFGGEAPYGSAYFNDTWLFRAGNWTNISNGTSPPPRSQYAMTYDAADSELVLFGGRDGTGARLSDTWVFGGSNWTRVHSRLNPQGRDATRMVYDGVSGQALLFGGYNATYGAEYGTWSFNAGQWTPILHSQTPVRSWAMATTFPNGTPLLFGGQRTAGSLEFNTSLEFWSGSWHLLHFPNAPPPSAIGGLVYDGRDRYVLQFGGDGPAGGAGYYGNTWKLS